MNPEIKTILDKLKDNGYEAYIIGGYVRDKLLGIESNDVDICTSATPKEIKEIFNINSNISMYGVYKIITNHYNFDITTYRKEITYNGRKPVEIKYLRKLEEDLYRRDFTINTICMDSEGQIVDLLNGIDDINNRLIKMVGNADLKIKEDPLRILRALRLAILLDFKLDKELKIAIKNNLKLLSSLSYTRKREELDRILVSQNVISGLKMLKKMNVLSYLELDYHKLVYVDNLYGMYAQLNISDNYPFNKNEKDTILKIKSIIKRKKITNEILFNNGLYISSVAGKILGIKQNKIVILYDKLPLKSKDDLVINNNDIIKVLNIKPSNIIKKIYNDLLIGVLNGNLCNDKDQLVCYMINNKRKWLNNE